MNLSEKSIFKSVDIPVSQEYVWNLWTTQDGLKSFFGRDNDVEIKLGGKFEIYFLEESEKERGSEGCQVLSFIPNEMLSFTWNAPPNFPEIRNSEFKTFVVVRFIENGGSTRVQLQHLGWPDDDKYVPVYEYFDKAWDFVMSNLQKVVKSRSNG